MFENLIKPVEMYTFGTIFEIDPKISQNIRFPAKVDDVLRRRQINLSLGKTTFRGNGKSVSRNHTKPEGNEVFLGI